MLCCLAASFVSLSLVARAKTLPQVAFGRVIGTDGREGGREGGWIDTWEVVGFFVLVHRSSQPPRCVIHVPITPSPSLPPSLPPFLPQAACSGASFPLLRARSRTWCPWKVEPSSWAGSRYVGREGGREETREGENGVEMVSGASFLLFLPRCGLQVFVLVYTPFHSLPLPPSPPP